MERGKNHARNPEQCWEVNSQKSFHVLLLDRPKDLKPRFSEFLVLSLSDSFRLEKTYQKQSVLKPHLLRLKEPLIMNTLTNYPTHNQGAHGWEGELLLQPFSF